MVALASSEVKEDTAVTVKSSNERKPNDFCYSFHPPLPSHHNHPNHQSHGFSWPDLIRLLHWPSHWRRPWRRGLGNRNQRAPLLRAEHQNDCQLKKKTNKKGKSEIIISLGNSCWTPSWSRRWRGMSCKGRAGSSAEENKEMIDDVKILIIINMTNVTWERSPRTSLATVLLMPGERNQFSDCSLDYGNITLLQLCCI